MLLTLYNYNLRTSQVTDEKLIFVLNIFFFSFCYRFSCMYQIFSNLWICSEIVNKKKINLFILYLVHIDIHTCVVFRICNKIKINIYVMFMFNYIMFNMYLVLVGFLYPFCVIKLRYLYVDTFLQYLQL